MTSVLCLMLSVPLSRCTSKDSSMDTSNEPDTIAVNVGRMSPIEVGVLTPSKKFVFLRSQEFSCGGVAVKDGTLTIVPSQATGYYWDKDGNRNEVAVFSERGFYEIHVADNLETESDGVASLTRRYSNVRAFAISVDGTCNAH